MPDRSSSTTPYIPPEIIERILSLLPRGRDSVQTLVACTLVSKDFSAISKSNVVWDHHLDRFIVDGTPRPVSREAGTAAACYASRDERLPWTVATLSKIERATEYRLPWFAIVSELGLDAYDILRHFAGLVVQSVAAQEKMETFLASRYWARELLGVIVRRNAVQTWERVAEGTYGEDPDALLRGLGVLTSETDPYCFVNQAFPRLLDSIVNEKLLPRLRKVISVPFKVEKTAACLVPLLEELQLMPLGGMDARLFLNALGDAANAALTQPSGMRGKLAPAVLALAVFCAVVSRLPAEFDIQAYLTLDYLQRPVLCVANASAKVGGGGGWCSDPTTPQTFTPRDVVIEDLCRKKRLSRKEIKGALLPSSTHKLVSRHIVEIYFRIRPIDPANPTRSFLKFRCRITQALLIRRHMPTPLLPAPSIDEAAFYLVLDKDFPYDIFLLSSVFMSHQQDEQLLDLADEVCGRILDRDAQVGVVKRRSKASGENEFRIGDVLSSEEVEGAVAVVGWELVKRRKGRRLVYTVVHTYYTACSPYSSNIDIQMDNQSLTHDLPAHKLVGASMSFSPQEIAQLMDAGVMGIGLFRVFAAAYRLATETNLHHTHTVWLHFLFDHRFDDLRQQFSLASGGLATHAEIAQKFPSATGAPDLSQEWLAQNIGTKIEYLPERIGLFGIMFLVSPRTKGGSWQVAGRRAHFGPLKGFGERYEEGWLEFIKWSLAGPEPGSLDAVLERRRVELSTGVLYDGIAARLKKRKPKKKTNKEAVS